MAASAHAQSSIPSARFVAHVSVIDPDTAGVVALDVFKARESGGHVCDRLIVPGERR
jgi:hypothetical protein